MLALTFLLGDFVQFLAELPPVFLPFRFLTPGSLVFHTLLGRLFNLGLGGFLSRSGFRGLFGLWVR